MEQIEIPLNEVVQIMARRIGQLEYDLAVATVQAQVAMNKLTEQEGNKK